MNQAVRVVALLQAREGRAAEVERLLLACVQPSRAEDGCLSYVLHRSLDEAGRFVFVERWPTATPSSGTDGCRTTGRWPMPSPISWRTARCSSSRNCQRPACLR